MVEQSFGTLHRKFHYARAAYFGLIKEGSVRIDTGGAYRQTGSDLAAARDIDIAAQSVDIRTTDNHGRSRQSERDLKIGTFAKISSPLIDLVNAAEGAAKSKADDRTRALQGLAAGARALGIHTDSATAHHSADSVPDLQKLLDKQQTVAQSTAAIHSAVGTYRGNRAKAAAEELEKQQAAHEGSLKERNDGSYEHYLSLSDAQRQQELLAHSSTYAQAYQEARSWGIGGSKSRALTAAETLITGALGGQGDLQLAANTLAPYAAAAIGKRFGHGEHKNEAAQAISHFMLGAALAYANGADPLAGGSAAVAAERAAGYPFQQRR